MSQGYSGTQGNVYVGANDCDTQGWSCDVETNTWDSTTTADGGWDDTNPSTNKVSGSFDILYNKAKKPFGTLGLVQGSTVALILYVNKTDGEQLTGNALVTKMSIKSKTKDGTIVTCSFTSKGQWTLPS